MPRKLTGDALLEKKKADKPQVELTLTVDEDGVGEVTALRVGEHTYKKAEMPLEVIIGVLGSVFDQLKSVRLAGVIYSFLQGEEEKIEERIDKEVK